MGKTSQIKTNFTAGEISPDVLGRGDLRAYENGALELCNVFINPTGGVKRRAGTLYRATLPGASRLVVYEYDSTTHYVLAVGDGTTAIYQDGALITSFATPWTAAQIDQINWAQSVDALLIVHPDVAPKKITRSAGGMWAIIDWAYSVGTNLIYQPYYKFAAQDVTLFSANITGTATITASAPIFSAAYVGVRLRIRTTECTITGYTNPTTVTATIHGTLAATPATIDWKEAAFTPLRGYPTAVAFHQDRLVIGGSKSLPNRLWLSKTGDVFHFDLGTGLDDESIEFGILSDQVNAIRAVVSGRHLQVFTSGAEYMVTGDPLTPTNVQIKRQTRIGSAVTRTIPPMDVDGATLFVSRNRNEIREFLYTDVEQAYQSTDLALLTRNMVGGAVDQDFDKTRRLLFVVRDDGKFATLTMFRPEQVTAWTLHETQGAARGVAVAGDRVFLVVERGANFYLEEFQDDVFVDAGVIAQNAAPITTWTGLAHLNGYTVKIVGDGMPQSDKVVSAGAVTIDTAATSVQIGLSYTHRIKPLPINPLTAPGAHKARLIRATLRLQNTFALDFDIGQGVRTVSLPGGGAPNTFTGDLPVMGYGWQDTLDQPLWTIESHKPVGFSLLSITTDIQLN
jgi:hypothetical protein